MKKKNLKVMYSLIFILITSIIGLAVTYFTGDSLLKISGDEIINVKINSDVESKDLDEVNTSEQKDEQKPKKRIKVYICGEVINPGVYTLDDGDRVEDVVQLAGGVTNKFNSKGINLAKKLHDEDRVVVPSIDDPVDIMDGDNQDFIVDINTGSKEKLMSLPGVGDATAGAIIRYRDKHGSFKSCDEIKNVDGIGIKKYEALEGMIEVK